MMNFTNRTAFNLQSTKIYIHIEYVYFSMASNFSISYIDIGPTNCEAITFAVRVIWGH